MNIKNKYEIGDELWTIDDNEVTHFDVQSIRVTYGITKEYCICGMIQKFIEEEFLIEYSGKGISYKPENKCFKTRKELIKSLEEDD